jgi:LAS superfamily LD-carboxypeptidase LdcB
MGSCATGLETVQGSYQLCKDVADKMKELLAAASAAGVNLQIVSAYRSADSSTVSGGGTAAASGMSNHQRGRAVDFSGFKNGPDKEGRFMWLQNNASKYGFYNILYKTKSDEYNHWSTTGK